LQMLFYFSEHYRHPHCAEAGSGPGSCLLYGQLLCDGSRKLFEPIAFCNQKLHLL
jgi:hypothetical protein